MPQLTMPTVGSRPAYVLIIAADANINNTSRDYYYYHDMWSTIEISSH